MDSKRTQSVNTHSIILDVHAVKQITLKLSFQSSHYLGCQGKVDAEFQNEVKILIHIITEDRIRHANGPVHALPSIPLHKYSGYWMFSVFGWFSDPYCRLFCLPSKYCNTEGQMNRPGQGWPLQNGSAEWLDLTGLRIRHCSFQYQFRVNRTNQVTLLSHGNSERKYLYIFTYENY